MTASRRIFAGVLVALTLVAAAVVVVMWHVGRDVTDSERFAQAAARTVATPEGAAAVADRLIAELQAMYGSDLPVATDAVRTAVANEAQTGAFRTAVEDAAAGAHAGLLARPETGFSLPTGALHPAVVRSFGPLQALGGAVVPPADEFPPIVVDVPSRAHRPIAGMRRLGDVWTLAIPIAVATLVLAAFVSMRPGGTVRIVGIGLVLLAALPALTNRDLPGSAADWTAPQDAAVARVFVGDIASDWLAPATVTLLVGLALIALGTRISRWAPGRSRTA